MAEPSLLQEKQVIQNEAEVMEMKEKLAKAQARARAYNNIALDNLHEAIVSRTNIATAKSPEAVPH